MNDMTHLAELMPQLRDILGLPGDLDLPPLFSIRCESEYDEPGWRVQAHLWQLGDGQTWDALNVWAAATGAVVEFGEPFGEGARRQVQASVMVRVAEVSVKVWAGLSEDFAQQRRAQAVAR